MSPTPKHNDALSDHIIEILKASAPEMMKLNDLAKALNIRSDSVEYDALRIKLNDMDQRKQIYKSTRRRFGLRPLGEISAFTGILRFQYNRGSVETGSKEFPVVYVREQELRTALDGDHVRVKLLALKKGKKPYGTITEILQRSEMPISGTLDCDDDFCFLIPDDDKYPVDFLIPKRKMGNAVHGDKVIGKFIKWEDRHKSPEAEIIEILGKSGDPSVEFAGIMKEFELPASFPAIVEEEAKAVAVIPSETELKKRRDLRDLTIITIDPDDAKDFDDALSLEKLSNGNMRLGVHIADVTAYVAEDSALDKEALKRATSTYLVDRVVPMLPESLSNVICSLQPHVTRLAFSVFMECDAQGNVIDYDIAETVINSKRRFTYAEAQDIIDTGKGDLQDLILDLHALATLLRENRYRSGGVDFVTQETKFILDEQRNPIKAILKSRTDATSLVEECMLLANQTVAIALKQMSKTMLKKGLLPFVYRVHDEPDMIKLKGVLGFVRQLGIQVPNGTPSSRQLNTILENAGHLPEIMIINQFMLRSMAKAIYLEENIGHYGLGFAHYTHFTSPIRRYPDIIVHRLLKEYARSKPSDARFRYLQDYVVEASAHCSLRERLAVDAERASIRLASAQLALKYKGGIFNGRVTGVTSFGLFILLDELNIEGLLHMSDLSDDYYYFDEAQFRLIGKKTKKVFRIGTTLTVKISNANIDKRQIDLSLVE
ncbi:MAG: ribonuclease R [Candidatus Kapaibacteriota bacterium]